MMTPSAPTCFASESFRGMRSPPSRNRRLPFPRTTGNTINRYSSTRSCSFSVFTSCALPWTTTSLSNCSLSLPTWVATSPLMTVELVHSGLSNVVDTTNLGMLLNLSANSPSLDGQESAKPSYVTRPRRRASLAAVCERARGEQRDVAAPPDQPLGLDDLEESSPRRGLGAVVVGDHRELEGPSGADVHGDGRQRRGEAARAEPARELLRVRPRLPHELARGVEDTGDRELPADGRGL